MPLQERNCRFKRLYGLRSVFHYNFRAILLLYCKIFIYLGIRAEPKDKSDNKSNAYLPDNFKLSWQSFLVMAEYLDIIVKTAEKAEPHRGDYHKYEIDIPHTSEQDYRQQYRHYDDYSTHRRHANLVYPKRVYLSISLCLCYLLTFQEFYEFLTEPCRNHQGQNQCQ